jgi:site-specific DNA-methyltransferase (adenine-specific)
LWLARKPLEGTVAGNVQTHGTGALNIDGCRVGGGVDNAGRWPPNLLLSHSEACVEGGDCAEDCPVAEMDWQSGTLKSGHIDPNGTRNTVGGNGRTHGAMRGVMGTSYGDSGGASRFFPVFRYQAKPSKSDKGESNTHPTVKSTALMEWLIRLVTPPGGTVLDPFMGSGTTGVAALRLECAFIGCEREPEYFETAKARLEPILTPHGD